MHHPTIKAFFHQDSSTLTYVVHCPVTLKCCVIDPPLDYDIFSGNLTSNCLTPIIEYIKRETLSVQWLLETHAHADHVTGSKVLKAKVGGQIAVSHGIEDVQNSVKKMLQLSDEVLTTQVFDKLFEDGERLELGELTIEILATPGHTPDSVTFVIGEHAFVGDTLFMPDSGSARCDFPNGSAAQLYQSIQKIYQLGDNTKLYMCHDYRPNNRELAYITTVAEQKKSNVQINETVSQAQYVEVREGRDAKLAIPRLLYPALQVNIRGGNLPQADSNGQAYIRMPMQLAD
ncbi:MBL fold metallo-hydrolase [Thalassotalea sp. LPB0316]|uniref:MBL fold metallo-hydrolase n=1 Tax=Thalassotalea sp. LPB0316 TaxID=2769490 RepID=UPI001868ED5A|nr:MBL fold metallo-hydrolase [Thalassotalea sp. LPB0316]QOL25202.1 MBL fold metallo-hydrolase [Thalassotalea sp. LPB0316]